MTYAFSLFNGVMPMGQNALGASAGFKGNGMCLSTRGLRRRPWKSYGLVEDMEYSWELRIAGERIAFEPEASVYGAMLGSGGPAAANQRRRWEFGRGEIRKRYLSRLLRSGRISWWEKTIAACELTIPSMSALVAMYLLLLSFDVIALSAPPGPHSSVLRAPLLFCCLLMTASLAIYGISPFASLHLRWRYLASTMFFPIYVGWKLLISLRGRPKEWVRTERASSWEELAAINDTEGRLQMKEGPGAGR
jgi:cellulose synthase/poly-beta-1,6-N-acetylglucosamine synthase-like glycosyltransferase